MDTSINRHHPLYERHIQYVAEKSYDRWFKERRLEDKREWELIKLKLEKKAELEVEQLSRIWNDLSGNDRHLVTQTPSGTATYVSEGVNDFPSIAFNYGQLMTNNNIPTPAGESVTVFVSFNMQNVGAWNQLVGQGHDAYWAVRRNSFQTQPHISMNVQNSNRPNVKIEYNTDYIAVGRVDGKKSEMRIYNMEGELVGSSSSTQLATHDKFTGGISNVNTKIAVGWSSQQYAGEGYMGEIRQIAIYDTYLSDTIVPQIVNCFVEKAMVNKLPESDDRWLFHTLTGNAVVNMVLAEAHIVGDEAALKVIDAGTYTLTTVPYHKDNAISTYWSLKSTKTIASSDDEDGFGLYNVKATIGYDVNCTVDHSGSGYTPSTSALEVSIDKLFPTSKSVHVKFESQIREITSNVTHVGSIIHVGDFIFTSTMFQNSYCNNNRWHSYEIIIGPELTVVTCDGIIIHEGRAVISSNTPATKYQSSRILLGAYGYEDVSYCRMKGSFRNFEVHYVEYDFISIPEVWCDEMS
eukprot:g1582.t1